GLMAAGNYYWVDLDRNKAAAYYQRLLDTFPGGKYSFNCEWRVAWVAYLNHQPNAADKFTAFLRKYPASANSPNALYWLGRIAEHAGNVDHARAYFAAGSPRLLFEAAQAAFDQGHFAVGMQYGRLIVPNFDARRFSDVPLIVWRTLYPLPYEAALRREAAKNSFDPMLAAGLIRQ